MGQTSSSKQCIISSPEVSNVQPSMKLVIQDDAKYDPDTVVEDRIETWNCHHILQRIEEKLTSMHENLATSNNKSSPMSANSLSNKSSTLLSRSPLRSLSSIRRAQSSQVDLSKCIKISEQLETIRDDIQKTIRGMVHNALDEIPNERSLLDYWRINSSERGLSVIIFEIDNIDCLLDKLGWSSGDRVAIETGIKIQEYCEWYSEDIKQPFALFHPDFNVYQFVVVSHCTDTNILEDFSQCVLIDVARSVKGFFQQTLLWAGYAVSKATKTKNLNKASMEKSDPYTNDKYAFRVWYHRALSALRRGINLTKMKDAHQERIHRWIPPSKRDELSQMIFAYLHELYILDSGKKMVGTYGSAADIICKIEKCIHHGANLEYCEPATGNTILHYALNIGNKKAIERLLQYDFDVDHKNNSGLSSLVVALQDSNTGQSLCVKIAYKCQFPNVPDSMDRVPFIYALYRGFFDVTHVLLTKGAIDWRNHLYETMKKDSVEVFEEVFNASGLPFSCAIDDELGRTVLHLSIIFDSYKLLAYCLERGADPDYVDFHGWTPLHYCILKDNIEMVKLLLNHNADIYKTNEENLTSIQFATRNRRTRCLGILLQHARLHRQLPLTSGPAIRSLQKDNVRTSIPLNTIYLGSTGLLQQKDEPTSTHSNNDNHNTIKNSPQDSPEINIENNEEIQHSKNLSADSLSKQSDLTDGSDISQKNQTGPINNKNDMNTHVHTLNNITIRRYDTAERDGKETEEKRGSASTQESENQCSASQDLQSHIQVEDNTKSKDRIIEDKVSISDMDKENRSDIQNIQKNNQSNISKKMQAKSISPDHSSISDNDEQEDANVLPVIANIPSYLLSAIAQKKKHSRQDTPYFDNLDQVGLPPLNETANLNTRETHI